MSTAAVIWSVVFLVFLVFVITIIADIRNKYRR